MNNHTIIVTSAFGVESVTKKELKRLGVIDPKANEGSFCFYGTDLDVARLNVFLRTGDRVYIKVKEFACDTFDMLFDNTASINWEDYLNIHSLIIVNGKSIRSKLFSLSDCQKIIKKAILTRLGKAYKTSTFDENGAKTEIIFSLRDDKMTLTINTSGKGLHKRGYRDLVGEAPLKETLACALIDIAHPIWDNSLVDPFCGSGTIVIESAMMALNIAPGKSRDFDFLHWENFDKNLYNQVIEEAVDREKLRKLSFAGYDIDPAAIKLALHHAERAGIKDYVHFQVRDMKELSSNKSYGCIITNPPYGERLLTPREADKLYVEFGKVCHNLKDWSINVITSNPTFEKSFGKKADKNRKFFNANKECRYYQYLIKK